MWGSVRRQCGRTLPTRTPDQWTEPRGGGRACAAPAETVAQLLSHVNKARLRIYLSITFIPSQTEGSIDVCLPCMLSVLGGCVLTRTFDFRTALTRPCDLCERGQRAPEHLGRVYAPDYRLAMGCVGTNVGLGADGLPIPHLSYKFPV